MKKAGIIVLLLIGIIAALPWVNGLVMERIVRNGLARMNRNAPASGVRFDLVSYHRGYGTTVAEWTLDLGGPGLLYGIREVRFTERATHGWTSVSSVTSLEKNDWYAGWVAGPLEGKDPLTVRTRYTAFDPIVTTITLDPLTLENRKKPLAVGALDVTITMDPAAEHIVARGNWGGIFEDDQNRLGPVALESDMKRVEGSVWEGSSRIAADTFRAGDPALNVSNLELAARMAADKDAGTMDIAFTGKAGDVSMKGESLSEWSFSGWSLGIRIRKMDIRAYQDLQRFYGKLIIGLTPALSDPGISPEKRDRLLKAAVRENQFRAAVQMEKLLKKGFGLEISPINITLPRGRVKGHLSLSLLKDMSLAGFLPVALRPDLALEIFSLDSRMEMPGEFLEANPNLTVPLFYGMETGLFELKDGRLRHRAATRDGNLYLNGRVVDLGGG